MKLQIVPISLQEANAFIQKHHRHHGPVRGHKFSIACSVKNKIVGVAIVGRPSSRILDDGWTLEVTRNCTDSTPHAASKLYSSCWKATRAMGYRKLISYTLNTEKGTSLIAAGWKLIAQTNGGSWNSPARPRVDKHPLQKKLRWEIQ